jgi:hypothetical protein
MWGKSSKQRKSTVRRKTEERRKVGIAKRLLEARLRDGPQYTAQIEGRMQRGGPSVKTIVHRVVHATTTKTTIAPR